MRLLIAAVLILVACVSVSCGSYGNQPLPQPATVSPEPSHSFLNSSAPLVTPTYDGSGQAMHPSIVYFSSGWHGWKYWMAVTPYPHNDGSKENPSLLVSNDGQDWEVPAGFTNPVTLMPNRLCDDELVYDPTTDQLWMYYVLKDVGYSRMVRKSSVDGLSWSAPQTVLSETYYAMGSPTVEKFNDRYYVWYVDASPKGYSNSSSLVKVRTSPDGANWSASQVATISLPGQVIWHIEIRAISPTSLVMLASSFPVGMTSGSTQLFLATSSDGLNWKAYSKIALPKGTGNGWDNAEIYRSTFLYDPATDKMGVWYSGRSLNEEWHTGYTEQTYTSLLQYLNQ